MKKTTTKTYYQQGDVLLSKIAALPAGLILEMNPRKASIKNNELAYGEAHDHCHALLDGDVNIFTAASGERYLEVVEPTKLSHIKLSTGAQAEHLPQVIEKGLYKFGQVQEFDPFEQHTRNVID